MLGVLPFLIQWIALGQLGSQDYYFQSMHQPTSYAPKSHWTLLNEFNQLPEEEIDHFLPQICNMILDRESLRDDDLFDYFESVIEQKCADCFSFGTRVCGVLKASQQAPSESLFRSILSTTTSSAQNVRTEERLRAFQERVEYATAYGFGLPAGHSEVRSTYYRDYQFLLDTLARLGTELKGYPVPLRNVHLRHALSQCNALLYFRMASRGSVSTSDTPLTDFQAFSDLSAQNIATLLPDAAQYSLHLPLHRTGDNVCRILRFVESECEVLPSKERCPYVVVVEVLEQRYKCSSNHVYTQGHDVEPPSVLSVRQGQVLYSGEQMSIEDEQYGQYGDMYGAGGTGDSVVGDRSAQLVAQSLDERQYNAHSAHSAHHLHTRDKYAVPRSPSRGKLLSTKLNQRRYYNAYTTSHNNNRGSGSGGAGSSGRGGRGGGIGYSRRATRYRSSPNAEHGGGVDSSGADDNKDTEREQLQESFAMYDDALGTTRTGTNTDSDSDTYTNNVITGASTSGSVSDSIRLFARPNIVIKVDDSAGSTSSGTGGEEEGEEVCILDDTADSDGSGSNGSTTSATSATSTTSASVDESEIVRTGSIRGGSTPPNTNHDTTTSANANTNINTYSTRRPSARFNRRPGRYPTTINANSGSGTTSSNIAQPFIERDFYRSEVNSHPLQSRVVDGRPHAGLQTSHDSSSTTSTTTSTTTSATTFTSATASSSTTALTAAPRYTPSVSWAEKRATLRANSPFGRIPGWDARAFIVKSGDDLRKEVLAMQVMEFCQKAFEMEGLDIYLRPYQILTTGAQAGLVEFLQGADSIDKIKKALQAQPPLSSPQYANPNTPNTNTYPSNTQYSDQFTDQYTTPTTTAPTAPTTYTLKQFFERRFGPSYSFFHARAVKNFVKSLVGYSLLTYLVQVKDRHNGNILFDEEGHVIHIDFGFILGDSPGFNINFESAPFKLTAEYVEVLGGLDSEDFKHFQDLFLKGFLALQKHVDGITSIVQLFYGDKRKTAADGIRSRLLFPQSQADILSLIGDSLDNWRTKQYDWYQERTNNIQL